MRRHCPLAIARWGSGVSALGGPKRYTSVASNAGCSHRAPAPGATMRGANDTTSSPRRRAAATAPPTMPGRGDVSASRMSTHSPRATAHPAAIAHGRPTTPAGLGGSSRRRMRGSCDAASSTNVAVPSVEPPSTTITSSSGAPWARSPPRHGPMRRASLRAGTMTDTDVPDTPASAPSSRGSTGGTRRRPRASRAQTTISAMTCASASKLTAPNRPRRHSHPPCAAAEAHAAAPGCRVARGRPLAATRRCSRRSLARQQTASFRAATCAPSV